VIRTIVEGEPGIFPEPVARFMRGVGGLFRRKPKAEGATEGAAGDAVADPTDAAAPEGPTDGVGGPDDRSGHSGDST
jgi:hypothetical protein